ncbi:Polysaccharide monooxygenase Cel61a 7 [Colletotrichum chlorophyti]|uniref:lytic cellulose monooxygenase (C4-dehydrogenating) n=1 Tax=Colletotrichum chlorophyti TaxID=708187 RepID=A0A1Q8RT09_9PEZI|nr:Polysaccharide monooxygenase Cel61a 7 [Colletotrichum chlorophyti]
MKYTITSLLGSAALVAAHGVVDFGIIGGENYTFYNPYQDPYMNPKPERISRPVAGNGPVEDVTSIDIQCGGYSAGGVKGSSPAALVAKAAAGSDVTLHWTLWPESHIGPVITYMAKCPEAGCSSWQPGTDKVWFKVQEGGRDGTSNTWAATPLMKAGNEGVKYTVPECIEPGQYLVRHEIIALHASYQYPGAQFYPGCHQLEVTGSGSTSPADLVAFPGAYSPTDAGITYDAYKAQEYTIPGPKLFTCGAGSGSGSAPVSSAAPVATSAPAATSAPSATVSSAASPTEAADDEYDEDCPAEPSVTPTPVYDDDEDDCPAESQTSSSAVSAAAAPTLTPEEEDEDDCPAEPETPTTTAAPVATPSSAAGDDDYEDDCPAETPSATPTPVYDDDEDDCPAETEDPVAATPTPTEPAGDDYDDEEDCPAETPSATAVAKRMSLHERRLA